MVFQICFKGVEVMENKILFINACVRADSRTAELSQHLLDRLDGEISEVNLYRENILPLDGKGIEKRNFGVIMIIVI